MSEESVQYTRLESSSQGEEGRRTADRVVRWKPMPTRSSGPTFGPSRCWSGHSWSLVVYRSPRVFTISINCQSTWARVELPIRAARRNAFAGVVLDEEPKFQSVPPQVMYDLAYSTLASFTRDNLQVCIHAATSCSFMLVHVSSYQSMFAHVDTL